MSQTKVQLIAPIGVVTATTLETTGVLGQNNQTQYSSPVQIPGTNWVITGNSEYSFVAFKS